jgi:hypothetical protein
MSDFAEKSDPNYRAVAKSPSWEHVFSVCCIVSDGEVYGKMRRLFAEQGFDSSLCEFLVCDNCEGNEFGAFEAVRSFMREAKGRYVVIAHQDVYPLDRAEKLIAKIEALQICHPTWGVIGNAGTGGESGAGGARSLATPGETCGISPPVVRVDSLDENLLIVRNGTGITVSSDLEGFHFYGFDICSVASRLGYSSHVLDFPWWHESMGTIDKAFFETRERLQQKLRLVHSSYSGRTTCASLYWGESVWGDFGADYGTMRLLEREAPRTDEARRIFMRLVAAKRWYFPPVFAAMSSCADFFNRCYYRLVWQVKTLRRAWDYRWNKMLGRS